MLESGERESKPMIRCFYCGAMFPGPVTFSVHRDYGEGPEVPLCRECATKSSPTLDEIWSKIAFPEPVIEEMQAIELKATAIP